jgi:chromosome segregation ATPase
MATHTYHTDPTNYIRDMSEADGKEYPPSASKQNQMGYERLNSSSRKQAQQPPQESQRGNNQSRDYDPNKYSSKTDTSVNRNPKQQTAMDNQNNSKSIYNKYAPQPLPVSNIPTETTYQQDLRDSHDLGNSGYSRPKAMDMLFNTQQTGGSGLTEQYQGLLMAHEELKNQVALLEVSLHNETLTNEEQRAYIEVLKQALEIKMNDVGLFNFVKHLSRNTNMSEVDLFVELNNVKTLIDHNQKDKKEGDEKFKNLILKSEELNENNEHLNAALKDLEDKFEKVLDENKRLNEALEVLQEENGKLSQEKDTLLDYIDKTRNVPEKLEEELKQEKANHQKTERERQSLQQKADDLHKKSSEHEKKAVNVTKEHEEVKKAHNQLDRKHQELENDHKKVASDLTQLKNKHDVLLAANKNLEKTHNEVKDDYEALDKRHMEALNSLEERSEQLRQAINENGKANLELDELTKELTGLRDEKENLEKENNDLTYKVNYLQPKAKEYEKQKGVIADQENQIAAFKGEATNFKELYEDSKNRAEKERQVKADEIKNLYEQLSQLRNDQRMQKELNTKLNANMTNLVDELKGYEDQVEKKQKQLLGQTKEINELKKHTEELNEENRNKQGHLEKLELDVQELNSLVEDCEGKLKFAAENKKSLMNELQNLTLENKKIKETHDRLLKSTDDLNSAYTEVLEDNAKLARIIDELNSGLKNLVKMIDERRGEAISPLSVTAKRTVEENLLVATDRVYNLLGEQHQLEKKAEDLGHQLQRINIDNDKLRSENDDIYKNTLLIDQDNKKLREEILDWQNNCSTIQAQAARVKMDFERLKDDYDKKVVTEHKALQDKIKGLDDKNTKLFIERSNLEFALNKYREFTLNNELNDLIEEAQNIHLHIAQLEKERLDIRIKIDLSEPNIVGSREGSVRASGLDSPKRNQEKITRRKLEEYRDTLADIESNIEIYQTKKASLENELNKVLGSEKQNYLHFQEYEKQNHQLKTEVTMLNHDLEVAEQTRKGLENSYNDTVRELKKIQGRDRVGDDRLNGSLTVQPTRDTNTTSRKSYGTIEKQKNYHDAASTYPSRSNDIARTPDFTAGSKNSTARYENLKTDPGSGSNKYDSLQLAEKYADYKQSGHWRPNSTANNYSNYSRNNILDDDSKDGSITDKTEKYDSHHVLSSFNKYKK